MKHIVIILVIILSVFSVSYAQENLADVRIMEIPIAMQCWTFHKFTFMETLQKVQDLGLKYLEAYNGQQLSKDNADVTFGYNLTDEQINLVKKKLQEHGITIVSYGVVNFDNNEKAMRQVFGFAKKMGIRTICTEPSYDDFSLIEKMVKEYNIKIAVHNHPIPSKYARPETAFRNIDGRDSRMGVCADTGHWMRSGVNPVDALRILNGRITNVHLKDLNEFGNKEAYDVPFGSGAANVHDILAELTRQNYQGYIAIEHENQKELDNPSPSIRKGLDYIKGITYYAGYERILACNDGRFNKHGWNHYGPGYFELDETTGILKSHKGMGLFWYTKKYGDFILELDYKTEVANANSGIFYRIPDMPESNAYIYKSFEIQIDDSQTGIHQTGSVYDAEAPKVAAFNKTGEWNHYKITLKGDNVKVELNGKLVVDWNMQPRGKIREFFPEGYIGLQNHDYDTSVYFKNIYVKELP